MTVAHVLLRSAQLWGDKPALIDTARGRTISFSELANAILFLGSTLRRHGLAAGDRVAILGDAGLVSTQTDVEKSLDTARQVRAPRTASVMVISRQAS